MPPERIPDPFGREIARTHGVVADRAGPRPTEPGLDGAGKGTGFSAHAGARATASAPTTAPGLGSGGRARRGLAIGIASVFAMGCVSALTWDRGPRPLGPRTGRPDVDPRLGGVAVGIDIPAIEVAAPVILVGTDADGALEVPTERGDAGWFAASARPGEVGASVIVGHVNLQSGPGVFLRLEDLVEGDRIVVHRADGEQADYAVERLQRVTKDEFPTDAVYTPTAEPTLRLVTCGGRFDRRTGIYDDNLIVYAA